jgi:hypothetical protein
LRMISLPKKKKKKLSKIAKQNETCLSAKSLVG